MQEINVYCDESNHLEGGPTTMVLGAVYCPVEKSKEINQRVLELKKRHGLSPFFEIKWTKITPSKKQFYLDLIDYFYDVDDLHFRAIVINKGNLDHERYNQTHDEWYYKMYFELLSKILTPSLRYNIYLDRKDTRGREKIKSLRKVLSNNLLDFEQNIISKVQEIRSHEVNIIQITDILIGALQSLNRSDIRSETKKEVIQKIKTRSRYELTKSTLAKEEKTNIFYWQTDFNQHV